jgi:hypothetical protein
MPEAQNHDQTSFATAITTSIYYYLFIPLKFWIIGLLQMLELKLKTKQVLNF